MTDVQLSQCDDDDSSQQAADYSAVDIHTRTTLLHQCSQKYMTLLLSQKVFA